MQLDIYRSAVSTGKTHKYLAIPSRTDISTIVFPGSLDPDLNEVWLCVLAQEFHHGQVRIGLSSGYITDILDQIDKNGYAIYAADVEVIVLRR